MSLCDEQFLEVHDEWDVLSVVLIVRLRHIEVVVQRNYWRVEVLVEDLVEDGLVKASGTHHLIAGDFFLLDEGLRSVVGLEELEDLHLPFVRFQVALLAQLHEEVPVPGFDGVDVVFAVVLPDSDLVPHVGSELVSEVGEVSDALIH